MANGILYLLPAPLGACSPDQVLPAPVLDRIRTLQHFIVEDPKTARAILKAAAHPSPLASLTVQTLNEHTDARSLPDLLQPLLDGMDVGLMSDAGCPGIADPGSAVVRLAHQSGIPVRPLVGPSSILLALMASGLEGQRFSFLGYLPAREPDRRTEIQRIEQRSAAEGSTQIFIETPYRNLAMLDTLIKVCRPDTQLTVATDLTLSSERIASNPIHAWASMSADANRAILDRHPSVFLLLAAVAPPRPERPPATTLNARSRRYRGKDSARSCEVTPSATATPKRLLS